MSTTEFQDGSEQRDVYQPPGPFSSINLDPKMANTPVGRILIRLKTYRPTPQEMVALKDAGSTVATAGGNLLLQVHILRTLT